MKQGMSLGARLHGYADSDKSLLRYLVKILPSRIAIRLAIHGP
jgi:hypothetical protein